MIKILLALIITLMPVQAGPFFKTRLSNGQLLEKNTQGYTIDRNGHSLSTINGQVSVGLNTNGSFAFSNRKLQLTNDVSSPGASKYYGTNGGSLKGYFALPSGTVSSVNNADTLLSIANKTTTPTITMNGALVSWSTKARPSGVVVGTTDTQTLTNKTLEAATLNGITVVDNIRAKTTAGTLFESSGGTDIGNFGVANTANVSFNAGVSMKTATFNGNSMTLPSLGQGSILFSKTATTLNELAKGTNHYALKVNGNRLAWEALSAGGSSEWTDNGSNLRPNELGDSVSIGKDFNNGKLNINGDIAFKGIPAPTLDCMMGSDYGRLYVNPTNGLPMFARCSGMSQINTSLIANGTTITSSGSSTDNHVPVWVGTTGSSLEDSPVVVDPMTGDTTGMGSLAISGGMSTPLVVNTSNLVADGTNVGIGTAGPDHTLDVVGTSEFSDQIDIANNKFLSWSDGMSAVNLIGLNSSNNLIIKNLSGMDSNGNIIFETVSGQSTMRLDKSQNVGIRDNSPDAMLDVNGSFLAKSFSFNGTTMSLPTLTQGDLLFSKEASTLNRLAKGANHTVLKTNGNTLAWETVSGGGSPGGADTQIQFNKAGAFAGNGKLLYDYNNDSLLVDGASFTHQGGQNFLVDLTGASITLQNNNAITLDTTAGTGSIGINTGSFINMQAVDGVNINSDDGIDVIATGALSLEGSSVGITGPTTVTGKLTVNGNAISIPSLGQGSILYSKSPGNLVALDNGAASNHKVLKVNGNALAWETASGGALPNFQSFTFNGTWSKPAGASFIKVVCFGAGGGGGSGYKGAAGVTRRGGVGGAGGAYSEAYFTAAELASTVPVRIGIGGMGGAAQSSNDTDGVNGTDGTASQFGTYVKAGGGGQGEGGDDAGTSASVGGSIFAIGLAGGAGGASTPTALTTGFPSPRGGGGGGNINSSNTSFPGINGATFTTMVDFTAAGLGGANTGVKGGNGTSLFASWGGKGAGGGGANLSGNAGRGGDGIYGSGGGGGGAAVNAVGNSGAGGKGGNGYCLIESW